MTYEELVEMMARAICVSQGQDPDSIDLGAICGPKNEPLPLWHAYEEEALAALSAIDAAGLRIVPDKATEAMVAEISPTYYAGNDAAAVVDAIIAAGSIRP